MAFNQSHSGPLEDIEGFIQVLPGTFKRNGPISTSGIDSIHLKRDCTQGSIVKGFGKPVFYSSAIDKPSGDKIYKEPGINFFKAINKSAFSHVTFFWKMMIKNWLILMTNQYH